MAPYLLGVWGTCTHAHACTHTHTHTTNTCITADGGKEKKQTSMHSFDLKQERKEECLTGRVFQITGSVYYNQSIFYVCSHQGDIKQKTKT